MKRCAITETRVGDARAWIRTQRDFTLRRLAGRPTAPPPESFLPVFGHLDAEMALLERQLKTPEDAYARSMVKLTELERDTAELAGYVQDKQAAARRVRAALEGFDPCGGAEIPGNWYMLGRRAKTVARILSAADTTTEKVRFGSKSGQ